MPGSAIGESLNLGFAGTISRNPDNIITARRLDENSDKVFFGQAVALNADNSVSLVSDTNKENFIGFAAREVKQTTDYSSSQGCYNPGDALDILIRGNMTVKCNAGTPTAGGKVYVRVAENPSIPAGIIGEIEAESDGSNTVLLDGIKFTTGKLDANRITEISILSRKI